METVYILGGAQTDFERNWTKEGKNVVALLKEAVHDALEDVGFSLEDIKKLIFKAFTDFSLSIFILLSNDMRLMSMAWRNDYS